MPIGDEQGGDGFETGMADLNGEPGSTSFGVDRAAETLAAAAAAARGGGLFTLPADIDPFEHYAQQPAADPLAEEEGSAMHRQDIPGLQLADTDSQVLRMAQDMAAFGANGGEGDWRSRERADQTRFDYFAA